MSRLEKAGLIERSALGYKASLVGKLVVEHCSGIEFLVSQREYFQGHVWEILPKSLLYRIHALQEAQFLVGVTYTLRTLEKMIASSKQYFSVATGEMPHSLLPPAVEGLAIGRSMKFVLTQNSLNQVKEFFKENPKYDANLLKRAEVKMVDSVFCCAGLNETTAATGLINRVDPHEHFSTHFIGTSEGFRSWCEEAFETQEARAKPL